MKDMLLSHLTFNPSLLEHVLLFAVHLALAILMLWAGWIVAMRLGRMLRLHLKHVDPLDPTLKPILASMLEWLIKILALVLALSQLGVQIAAIAALIGAAGLAIGLALQGTLQNIAAGIMLILLRPVRVGEYIEGDGCSGTVLEIGLFNTLMEKADGIYLFVPNSKLWSGSITNYSRHEMRRLELIVKVDFHADVQAAVKVLDDYLRADKRVLVEPAPQTMVSSVDGTCSEITMRAWTKRADYWNLRYDLFGGLRAKLSQAGVSMVIVSVQIGLAADAKY